MMSEVKLPTCDQSLPSKWNKSETCTEAGLFEREDSKVRSKFHFVLFDLILYVSSTIFQLCWDGSSLVEPGLS